MRVLGGLGIAALGVGLTACSGAAGTTPGPGTSGACSLPEIPAFYLAYPPTGATGVATTNLSVDFGISGGPGRTWSVTLVPASGATISGSTPTVITSLPAGSASPPSWVAQSSIVTDFASAMPALQPSTTYTVDLTITFATSGPCPSSTSAIGSFTTT